MAITFVPEFTEAMYDKLSPKDVNVVVFDDQMATTGKKGSKEKDMLTKLFVQGSHHRSITTMYMVQNLFDPGNKGHRTLSINAQYMVLFKNPRDGAQIEYIGRQMYPKDKGFLTEAFEDATQEPYSYLLLDMRPETPVHLRVRSNVMGMNMKENGVNQTVYVPTSMKNTIAIDIKSGTL
jgi:hypothetical protein